MTPTIQCIQDGKDKDKDKDKDKNKYKDKFQEWWVDIFRFK